MHDHAVHPAHGHAHAHRHYWLGCAVTLGFAAIEALAGGWAHSLALLGDAGHMATDGLALALAAAAAWAAGRPVSHRHSFGLGRLEVMAALMNTLLMLAIVVGLVVEAIARLRHPSPLHPLPVMLIGAAGLVINLLIYRILEGGQSSLNLRASLLHVLGDMLGSAAALLSGVVVFLTGWLPIDPLLSFFIAGLILVSSLRLLREAGHVLLEGVPLHMDLAEIGRSMAAIEGVESVHDLHVWSVSSGEVALSAHVVIEDIGRWEAVFQGLRAHLHDVYAIEHITLQPEPRILARVAVTDIRHR